MWTQLEEIREVMLPIFKRHPEGVNMICYSQGNLPINFTKLMYITGDGLA